jgi:hypothetical protein
MKEEEEMASATSPSAPAPDMAWVEAMSAELTEELIDGVRNFARLRALGVANAGRKVDEYYVRELVQDVIGDTFTGVLHWDPNVVSLKTHLLRAVQFRSRDDREHEKSFPHDSIGDGSDRSVHAENEASELANGAARAENRRYAAEVMAQIRDEARADKAVLRLLDAYDAGASTKSEVMACSKMKARTYHNARIRLSRLARNLTNRKLADKARA